MKILYVAFFLSLFLNQTSAQQWTVLNAPTAGRYDDLFFLNDTLGWACSSAGVCCKTEDGGDTWSIHTVKHLNYLRSIEFMDKDTGFCGGLDAPSFLFKTTDGGETWNDITPLIPGLEGGICGLSCPGGQVVYGCGVWHYPSYFIKSTDGGISWEKTDMSAYASALVDMLFISRDTGWVCGKAPQDEGGVILYTTDGGSSWQTVCNTHIAEDYIWKIQRLDAQRWFASIERNPVFLITTQILKSTDGGIHWDQNIVKNNYVRLQTVGFITPQHGWTGNDAMFETKNGGQSWQSVSIAPFASDFNRFVRINDNRAFLTGDRLYRYGLTTSTNEVTPVVANNEIHELKVSPNPASDDVRITVNLRQKTQVMLKIYAYDGGLEETLWTGEHEAGEYIISSNLRQRPPGTYVVYLKTHHGTQHVLLSVSSR